MQQQVLQGTPCTRGSQASGRPATRAGRRQAVTAAASSAKEVTLLDYGAGNIRSVRNAIKRLGYTIKDVRCAPRAAPRSPPPRCARADARARRTDAHWLRLGTPPAVAVHAALLLPPPPPRRGSRISRPGRARKTPGLLFPTNPHASALRRRGAGHALQGATPRSPRAAPRARPPTAPAPRLPFIATRPAGGEALRHHFRLEAGLPRRRRVWPGDWHPEAARPGQTPG
jgi:hypothetical protein